MTTTYERIVSPSQGRAVRNLLQLLTNLKVNKTTVERATMRRAYDTLEEDVYVLTLHMRSSSSK